MSNFVVPSYRYEFKNEPEEATEGHRSEYEVVSLLHLSIICADVHYLIATSWKNDSEKKVENCRIE